MCSKEILLEKMLKKERSHFKSTLMELSRFNESLSEDIIQDACLKILLWDGEVEDYKHMCCLFTKVIKQLLNNFYMRESIRIKCENDLYHMGQYEIRDNYRSFEYYPYTLEIKKRIKKLVKTQQSVIQGIFFEGLEWKELSRKYKIKHTNVPAVKQQALNHLRKPVFAHRNSTVYKRLLTH